MPAYRKNIYTYILQLYVCFVFLNGGTHLISVAACNITATPAVWGRDDYPNPREDVDRCGRNCTKSWICDPSQILTNTQADTVDEKLRTVTTSGKCTCPACTLQEGYLVYVALMERMEIPARTSKGNAARYFAENLRKKWMNGTCGNIVVIVISKEDRQVNTNAGPEAYKTLTLDCIELVYNEVKSFLTNGDYYTAINKMIHRYNETFNTGKCPLKAAEPETAKSNGGIIVFIVLAILIVIILCVILSIFLIPIFCKNILNSKCCVLFGKCLSCECCEKPEGNRASQYATGSNSKPKHTTIPSARYNRPTKSYARSNNPTSFSHSTSSGAHTSSSWHHSSSFTHTSSSYSGGGGCDSGFSGGGSSDGGGGGGGDF